MELEKYFDEETMSLHLREGSWGIAKKGRPGKWRLVKLSDEKLTRDKIKTFAQEILEQAEGENSFLEIEREGSSILQIRDYRVVITRPPFSDGWEITVVRPVVKLSLSEYNLNEELKKRLVQRGEGILIAGSPGEGKTTLARALAEYYASLGRVVKTIESPRDLSLKEDITQYSLTYGDRGEIYDVLLLSRPDNTFFDEMRTTEDFQLFADLRLAGIGLVGVLHATTPIEAIQRFIGRIEIGLIPQIIDTVIFVEQGTIGKVFQLEMKVKVPFGMTEADLARPVVEVRDFFTRKLNFEIYTYGEQTVVIPVGKEEKETGLFKLGKQKIKDTFKKYTETLKIEIISNNKIIAYVPSFVIPKILGKQGREIEKLEKELGLRIDLRELKKKREGKEIAFDVKFKKNLLFYLDKNLANREVAFYSGEDFLISTKTSKKGLVKINPRSESGKKILEAVKKGNIQLVLIA